jgi:hypothetical protein
MYIDFESNKLEEELKQKTLDHLADQGIPPVVSGQGIAPGGCVDPCTGEDGGDSSQAYDGEGGFHPV